MNKIELNFCCFSCYVVEADGYIQYGGDLKKMLFFVFENPSFSNILKKMIKIFWMNHMADEINSQFKAVILRQKFNEHLKFIGTTNYIIILT